MKGAIVTLCGVECVNLRTNAVKILGIYLSYNKKLENEKKLFRSCNKTSRSYKYVEYMKSIISWENNNL